MKKEEKKTETKLKELRECKKDQDIKKVTENY